jgi:hypothetical protein
MKIHVAHNGEKLGPFAPEEIRGKLVAGELHTSDLAWYEGAPDWLPILSVPELVPPRAEPPSVPGYRLAPQSPTSPLAIASLVLGIVSLTLFPLLPGIPAVVCGHLSLKEIHRSAGAIGGRGAAIAGLVTGYISVAIMILLLVGLLAFVGFASSRHARNSGVEAPSPHSHSAPHVIEPETPVP